METSPGVVVERRCFLRTAALALGATALPGFAPPRLGDSDGPLDVDAFIAEAVPVARVLVADPSKAGQDRYLLTLAACAVRLADVPQPEFRESGQGDGTFIGSNGAPGPFVILHWKMDPGSTIRSHAHTYGNVVTLGLDGIARIENHEVVGEADYDAVEPFRVRRTLTQRLTPGAVNLVNLERDYIHGFRAGPEGARGLDITTRIGERRSTPYLEIGDPVPGEPDVWTARWGE